jgi:hypothetical protein
MAFRKVVFMVSALVSCVAPERTALKPSTSPDMASLRFRILPDFDSHHSFTRPEQTTITQSATSSSRNRIVPGGAVWYDPIKL